MSRSPKKRPITTLNKAVVARSERILILDFGSQYTPLIARRVRELQVYSEVLPYHVEAQRLRDFAPTGVILSGGPASVIDAFAPALPPLLLELGCPLLGICYGMQVLVQALGGEVTPAQQREFGYATLRLHPQAGFLTDLATPQGDQAPTLATWMSHSDRIDSVPEGFVSWAYSEGSPHAVIADEKRHYYGLQFHPEVDHTPQGKAILRHFLYRICGCQGLWQPESILEERCQWLRAEVGADAVVLALSGGVDSAVTALLLQRALGDQVTALFVDHGLLRLREGDQVMAALSQLGLQIRRIDAAERFFTALQGVSDPEKKRQIIGALFIQEFQQAVHDMPDVRALAQGTIYSDVIESAALPGQTTALIKSHHNVGGLPDALPFRLIEPLRLLFKDEVRQLGASMGLASELLARHPFPGPGLAVRILGEVSAARADILRQADDIFLQELRTAGWYQQVSQAFAVLLPVSSVGVTGDGRNYQPVLALRAVVSSDFMTARWARLPAELLDSIARRITNEISGISRVVYDISDKPPATIEWE